MHQPDTLQVAELFSLEKVSPSWIPEYRGAAPQEHTWDIFITWDNLDVSNTRSQLCSFLTHRQPKYQGLDAVFSYSRSKGRRWKLCTFISEIVWCPHLPSRIQDSMQVLYWVNRIRFFVDVCNSSALDLLQAQPALLSPHVPVTGFVMKTHFILEMMLFGHRHSQNVKTVVSKSFPSKEWAKARAVTKMGHQYSTSSFSLDTTIDFVKTPKISRNVVQKELFFPLFLQRNNTTSIYSGRCILQGPQMYHNKQSRKWVST